MKFTRRLVGNYENEITITREDFMEFIHSKYPDKNFGDAEIKFQTVDGPGIHTWENDHILKVFWLERADINCS